VFPQRLEVKRIGAREVSSEVALLTNSGPPSKAEEERITQACQTFGVRLADCGSAADQLKKASILRGIDTGDFPNITVVGRNPLQLQAGEKLLWAFNGARRLEYKKSVSYVGGSRGISVRIARGLYYRTGAYSGHRVEHEHIVDAGGGDLAMTTKNIYFVSPIKSLRLPIRNVISVNLFSDGIELSKATGKPLIFKIDDPAFAANILSHLSGQ
jgi:hypothetical protein